MTNLFRLRDLRVLRGCLLVGLFATGCAGEPQSWAALKKQLPGLESEQRDAAVEKFIAARGGTPIVENQTRLVFFARDVNGKTPRVVGDFNAWAATPQGYDAAIGKMTRIDGTTWSYLEGTAYTNARAEYVLFFDADWPRALLSRRVAMFVRPFFLFVGVGLALMGRAAPPAALASALEYLRLQKSYSWEMINADPGPVAQRLETRRGNVTLVARIVPPTIPTLERKFS